MKQSRWSRFCLTFLLLALGVLGCGEVKSMLGLYPTGVNSDESVEQRHYMVGRLEEVHEAALRVLRSLGFRIVGDRKRTDRYEPVRVIDAERNGGETVRMVIEPQGGPEVMVCVQVKPVESTLGTEIHTELAAHLRSPAPP